MANFVQPEDVTATMGIGGLEAQQKLQAERQKFQEGLPSFGETMYRSAADVIGTPVDVAAMALAPFGYDEKAPIGGSEYFKQMGEQKGIISTASNPVLEIAASLMVPDPLDVLTVTKMATPMLLGMVGEGVAGLMKKPSNVDFVLEQAAGMDGNINKFLNENINMRDLSPEDKAKVIQFRKGAVQAKPKAAKETVGILAPSLFQEGIYSKLEDEIMKMPDDMQFANREEIAKYLESKGVTKAEIEGSRVLDPGYVPGNNPSKGDILNQLSSRPDKIEKKSIVEEAEGGATQDFDDWESDWVRTDEQASVSVGESGAGIRISDDRTGRDVEIGYSYDYDRYVDDSGYEYDYDEMLNDWHENYYDGRYDDEVAEVIADGDLDPEDTDAITDWVKERAMDDGLPYETHYNKEIYENDYGQTYDDLDEAVTETKNAMYEDYRDYADEVGGETYEGYTVSGGENYDMEVYRMPDYSPEVGKFTHEEPHLGDYDTTAENVAFHVRKKDRTDVEGNDGVVLEELQSQWEQDWRAEGGGAKVATPEERTQIEADVEKLQLTRDNLGDQIKSIRKEMDDNENNIRSIMKGEVGKAEEIELQSMENLKEQLNQQMTDTRLKITEQDTAINREKGKLKEPRIGTPPIAKRTQYEKIAIMDQLKNAVKSDKDYFGFINGHVQNGSFQPTTKGMIQAYDVELPRIIQKLTGEKPYMASFDDGLPITGEKVVWDAKKAADGEHYQNIAGDKNLWYWRVDLTPEIKDRITKSKTQLYTHPATMIGAGAVGGAAMYEGEDDNNTLNL